MLTCDKCKKEINAERGIARTNLPYDIISGVWQTKDFDLCGDCRKSLSDRVNIAKSNFINEKKEEET